MLFRQLFDADSWTYTYLLADPESGEAILIDPVLKQYLRDTALVRELGYRLSHSLETHVHADHVTGSWLLREHTGCQIIAPFGSGVECADRLVKEDDRVEFGSATLRVLATPGHTDSCVTYVAADKTMAFTGDALMIRGCGRTDLDTADPRTLYHSVRDKIFALPRNCTLYPAHDYAGRTMTTVREERYFNPRLRDGTSEGDFVGYMNHLRLPHPRLIDIAIPANLRCGEPAGLGQGLEEIPKWGPVVRTYSGIWEINPLWVQEHCDDIQLVDVRECNELNGETGHVENVISIPLSEFRKRMRELARDKPVVTVCQSGARSGQAAEILQRAGRTDVANLSGGMLRWNQMGLPVVRSNTAA